MSLKTFLTKPPFELEDILEDIKKDCSEYLKNSDGLALYRGKQFKAFAGWKVKTPSQRRLLNTDAASTYFYNICVENFFNIEQIRVKNAVFATGDSDVAYEYGALHFFFPCNGYKFVWSPTVDDFYDSNVTLFDATNWYVRKNDDTIKSFDGKAARELREEIEAKFKVKSIVEKYKTINDAKKYLKQDFGIMDVDRFLDILFKTFKKHNYQDNQLAEGISSDSEITFQVKEYYALDVKKTASAMGSLAGDNHQKLYDELFEKFNKD